MDGLYAQAMEPGVIYNMKKRTWHTVVLSRDASVLIMENADTGGHNTQTCELRLKQRRFIREAVRLDRTARRGPRR
ncbi:MAG: hypothetical protein AB1531_01965 [Chloroflexota bacterium]